jgi:hypothetical protein
MRSRMAYTGKERVHAQSVSAAGEHNPRALRAGPRGPTQRRGDARTLPNPEPLGQRAARLASLLFGRHSFVVSDEPRLGFGCNATALPRLLPDRCRRH